VIAGLLPEKGGAANASQELTGWQHQSSEEGWNQPSQVEVHGFQEGVCRNEEGVALMPKVGKKKFPYTAKGKSAAKAYAKKTGKKVSKKRAY
jgi:hypothetical protein